MFKHVIQGISIASVLDRRRAMANGDYPIRILVHYRKSNKYYTTGKTCTENIWSRLPSAKSHELMEMRGEIQACFDVIKKHIMELHEKDDFSIPNLDRSLYKSSGRTLSELFDQKIAETRRSGQIGTMQSYENTLINIRKFKHKEVPVENVTVEWLEMFHEFMARDKSLATISIYMRNLRTMMNVAKKDGYINDSQYPFGQGKYVIKTKEGVKKALTVEQIKKIKRFSCIDNTLMMTRDIWLFIYYCNGINIADLINLKFENIIDDEIHFIRAKTRNTAKALKYIKATLKPEMKEIISRWGNDSQPNNYLFNLVNHSDDPEINIASKKWFTKQFNQRMKVVGAAVGVYNVTSYTARHSYATVLKRQNVNIAFISESLGHTSLNTTQTYLDSFEKEERAKNAGYL